MQKLSSEKFIVFTDGGSRGNPGPAALGIVVQNEKGEVLKTYGQYLGERTNNEAEYEAVIFALKKLKALWGLKASSKFSVEFRIDSQLVVEQLSDRYKITEEHIGKLYLAVRNLKMDFGGVTFTHIPREKNIQADRLVNEALDASERALQRPSLNF
ncbi:MAG: ribonuclease HI family protein [bacterium]|nr:ribonuclease HI family protein [bacterium]